jgi:prepilin-type N-terminal cleavage/methylation domain-containing protein
VREAGFSLIELIAVVAMIGILAVLGTPMMISYWRTSTTTAAASELATSLNRARQLAIASNQNYCAQVSGTDLRYVQNTTAACGGGAVWTGSGTRADGTKPLGNGVTVAGGPVVFTALGAAALAGTFTVTNPQGGTRNVVVAASGRVSVQ